MNSLQREPDFLLYLNLRVNSSTEVIQRNEKIENVGSHNNKYASKCRAVSSNNFEVAESVLVEHTRNLVNSNNVNGRKKDHKGFSKAT